MDKKQQDKHYQQPDSMSRQKNGQNSNQNKNHQRVVDEEMENINREIAAKTSGGTTSNAWNKNYYEDDVDQGTYYNRGNQKR